MIDPGDVQRAAGRLLLQPVEIVGVMDHPQAGDGQGDGRSRALPREQLQKIAVQRAPARAQIAGDEDALALAAQEAGVLQNVGRRGSRLGLLQRAHESRVRFRRVARIRAAPAPRAFEARREAVRIDREQQRFGAQSHPPRREFSRAGVVDAALEYRMIVARPRAIGLDGLRAGRVGGWSAA